MLPSGSSLLVGNPSLQDKPAFDTVRDRAPVTLVGTIPNRLVIHPGVAARTVGEFVAPVMTSLDPITSTPVPSTG